MHFSADTIAIRANEGFDIANVEHYLFSQFSDLPRGPLQVRQFAAGASNLTYLLQIGSWEAVLRRPPPGPLPARGHDMEREGRLLAKVHPQFSLAPQLYLFCADRSIIGVPFYVMERRNGFIYDQTIPSEITPNADFCQQLSFHFIDTLVQIHSLDWQNAGLTDLGHPDGFLARQVKSWFDRYTRAQTDELAELQSLIAWFSSHLPVSPAPTLIHNDFKINNMRFQDQNPTQLAAVLDWEMATIGDPLLDLGVALSYWVTADDPPELQTILPTVTTAYPFPNRARLIDYYAQKSGRNLTSLPFYLIFAYFKLAVIVQQIYARWRHGQTTDPRFAHFGQAATFLIRHAAKLVEKS